MALRVIRPTFVVPRLPNIATSALQTVMASRHRAENLGYVRLHRCATGMQVFDCNERQEAIF